MRTSGVLMHISSLPSSQGIGTFGQSAYKFVDLKRTPALTSVSHSPTEIRWSLVF